MKKFFYLTGIFVLFFVLVGQSDFSQEEFLSYLLQKSNPYLLKQDTLMKKTVSYITNPLFLTRNSYQGVVERSVKEAKESNNLEKEPLVYLYSTHQTEEFANTNLYETNSTVVTASYILKSKLASYNIPSLVEESSVIDLLNINGWPYYRTYEISRMYMEGAKAKNPSLTYFIDVHRDSVSRDISTVTIGDKSYAKILFIVGLENPGYQANLELTTKLKNLLDEKYPGIMRIIYEKQGEGVNGVYNQDFSPNAILIELGGQDNTILEVYNTVSAFADVFHTYLEMNK